MGLVVLAQSGLGLLPGTDDYGRPQHLAEPLGQFPNIRFVLGHLGRGYWHEPPELAARYPNLFFDMSYAISAGFDPPELTDDELRI